MVFFNKRGKLRIVSGLLREWYGDERASREMSVHCPPPRELGEVAEQLVAQLLPQESRDAMNLAVLWPQLVGKQLAAVSNFVGLKKTVVTIEVTHPVWLREFNALKKVLITKINTQCQRDICRELRFIPTGGRYQK
ncbi:DciA family protein [Victivallis sp. Marseille-Q1083]|uniref:DciA family protein n=1 Tax=Victivallis sp. Marseille-Q1083 TaxID=2717288 RepID=UPI00158A3247|nr:DciA family protein [Victivallis sp. Marseille-Q1083]